MRAEHRESHERIAAAVRAAGGVATWAELRAEFPEGVLRGAARAGLRRLLTHPAWVRHTATQFVHLRLAQGYRLTA